MKIHNYIYSALAVLVLSGCEKDHAIDSGEKEPIHPSAPDENDKDEENKPEEKKVFLSFETLLSDMTPARSGAIDLIESGDSLSVFRNDTAYSYVYDGDKWNSENPLEVKDSIQVAAVFPHIVNNVVDGFVTLDIQKQMDYMWAGASVSRQYPSAVFDLEHKLALLQIKIVRGEYLGKGMISDVQLHDTYINPKIQLSSGYLLRGDTKGTVTLKEKYIVGKTKISEFMVTPKFPGENVYLTFKIDGEPVRLNFSDQDFWESGLKYTYTIGLRARDNSAIYREDVPVDVEFWSQYGKTDDIIFKEPAFDDNENFFTISVRHKTWGYCAYQNEGAILHFNYMHYGEKPFNGKVRAVLTKNGKIVEKFQPIPFDKDNMNNKVFKCQAYITSNPGTYKIDLIFQREGETTWFHGMEDGTPEEYTIKVLPKPADDVPALRELYLEKEEGRSLTLLYDIPYNDSFNVTSIISNKKGIRIKGTIRAIWERQFNVEGNSYFPSEKRENSSDDVEWFDVIGEKQIDIPADARFWKSNITCKVPVAYAKPKFWVMGWIHLYWKGEYDTEWSLIRLDTDNLYNQNYDGYVFDSVNNYIGVLLDSWN